MEQKIVVKKVNENNVICFIKKEIIDSFNLSIDDFLHYNEKAKQFSAEITNKIAIKYFSSDTKLSITFRFTDKGDASLDFKRITETEYNNLNPDINTGILDIESDGDTDENIDFCDKQNDLLGIKSKNQNNINTFRFTLLSELIRFCKVINPHYKGNSCLFKDKQDRYCLYLSDEARLNNIAIEFCQRDDMVFTSDAQISFFDEHDNFIMNEKAVPQLASM